MFIAGLISIIVPIYNVADYLDECVFSLVNQTYKNIEIILIDDGSTDASGTMCDKWKKLDKRIKVIHTNNYGVSHARNAGLDIAKGDYIGFVDGDDWLEKETYELLLREIIDKGTDVAGGGYIRENEKGSYVDLRKENARTLLRDDIIQEVFSCNIPKLLFWELCDKLIKKELVTKVRFDEKIHSSEDMLFFWQVMKKCKSFSFLPLYKYHYRMRKGSAIHSMISPKSISSLKAISVIWNSAQNENEKTKKGIWELYARSLLGITKQMLIYDAVYYENAIKINQKIIRNNIRSMFGASKLSIKMFFGVLFCILPFQVCKRVMHVYAIKYYSSE